MHVDIKVQRVKLTTSEKILKFIDRRMCTSPSLYFILFLPKRKDILLLMLHVTEIEDSIRPKYLISLKKIPSAKPARGLRISRFACHASRVTSVISLT